MTRQSSSYVFNQMADPERRAENDFYRSEGRAARDILNNEQFTGPIWEPACGDGALARVFKDGGYKVKATDLIYRGYGEQRSQDFLKAKKSFGNIVTNPPFEIAEPFVAKALELYEGKLALILRLAWLEGIGRYERLWSTDPPARIWVPCKRYHYARNGVEDTPTTIATCWFVWDREAKIKRQIGWIYPEGRMR